MWKSSSMRDFTVALCVFSVVCWVFGNMSKNEKFYIVSEIVFIFDLLHFFIHSYYYRQQLFFSDNRKAYALPEKKIRFQGGLALLLFLLLACFSMALCSEFYSGTLVQKISILLGYLFGGIFGALIGTGGMGRDELYHRDFSDMVESLDQLVGSEQSMWDKIINKVQTVLIVIGLIILAVVLISMLIAYIRNMISSRSGENRIKNVINLTDTESRIGNTSAARPSLFDRSSNAKIRRIYIKTIENRKRKAQSVPRWMAPSEIEELFIGSDEEKYRTLHEYYEKARYSEGGSSEDDAELLKKLNF